MDNKYKVIIHLKFKILHCTHPHIFPNLYDFILQNTKADN